MIMFCDTNLWEIGQVYTDIGGCSDHVTPTSTAVTRPAADTADTMVTTATGVWQVLVTQATVAAHQPLNMIQKSRH